MKALPVFHGFGQFLGSASRAESNHLLQGFLVMSTKSTSLVAFIVVASTSASLYFANSFALSLL